MSLALGIIGLPNVGKSTLFNALSSAKAEVSNYPFCTIDPNIGVVEVPDERLAAIQKIMHSAKAVPAAIEFYDIAGLVKGAHQGEGLGNKFLSHIRNVDALIHVVRCFNDPQIVHVAGQADPEQDIAVINLELILSDLVLVKQKLENLRAKTKAGDKKIVQEADFWQKIYTTLDSGQPARGLDLTDNEKNYLKELPLLSIKPVLYLANVDESGNQEQVEKIRQIANQEKAGLLAICSKLEAELAELPLAEAQDYLQSLGEKERGLEKLIKESYRLLGLITFFTANAKETRAWSIAQNTLLPQAAGKIHSDMERGFIAAEVASYADLLAVGAYAKLKEKGCLRVEGKSYIVKDGDLVLIRFTPTPGRGCL